MNIEDTIKPGDFFKYGYPGPVHDLGAYREFISCYDRQTKNPYWVVEHITADSLKRNGDTNRGKSVFKEDEKIPMEYRGLLRNYFRSGYDRGHQAPAADAKFSQEAMDETFYLSNMCPQVGQGFNRDYWAHFEDFARRLTSQYKHVRIVTGPLYLPKKYPDGKYRVSYEVIGNPPNVAVPTHFFKLIVGERTDITNVNEQPISAAAFILPNDRISNDVPLRSFQVPVEALERSTGLSFFHQISNKSNIKNLCDEVKCDIIVREFPKALPAPEEVLSLPAPKD
ncbi:ribonuclease ASCRUDRAFT_38749 [Ascoidea rubescens DSM 1968]|uniref:Endonuclease n=1 Tax=Ascoidea rubescens DSM 1968 TaxID=1344418 RepID=A0A1D2VB89_9ASCO|nr:hypothetical protein ASCRUDRAFT_38749 [Ascoidea rubescens DSM 1968]ODV58733.1 hypothetical protein ASCRUDRAFT_38749 [Ascoidea rubescens DSM 1968]